MTSGPYAHRLGVAPAAGEAGAVTCRCGEVGPAVAATDRCPSAWGAYCRLALLDTIAEERGRTLDGARAAEAAAATHVETARALVVARQERDDARARLCELHAAAEEYVRTTPPSHVAEAALHTLLADIGMDL